MPRKLFKKWVPDPQKIRNTPGLSILGTLLDDPNLFHLNRHSVSTACFLGIFIGFLPIPGVQMLVVALSALIFRCNLPICITLIWISNPLTMPFMYWAELELGDWILGGHDEQEVSFELSWIWVKSILPLIWQPLLLGSVIIGLFFGGLSYFLVQWFWRWHVIDRWKARKKKKAEKQR